MEQRRLRLGDILDDYCPRERRVTNHAVVAMIEETVKQTRCTTCDAEHPYKGGQAPRRKKKETAGALYREVLAGKPDDAPGPVAAASTDEAIEPAIETERDLDVPHLVPAQAASAAPVEDGQDHAGDADAQDDSADEDGDVNGNDVSYTRDVEEGPVHRQLIRATLPRPEGQKDPRTPPDFTIRQPHGRGGNQPGNFRGHNNGNANRPRGQRAGQPGNGHRPFSAGGNSHAGSHSGSRFGRQGQGQGHGRGQQGGNFRNQQQPRQGGGRKRSR
jgi:hypothetical protein